MAAVAGSLCAVTPRAAIRSATVVLLSLLTLLITSPAAHAVIEDDGDDPGAGLPIGETILYFVVAPLAISAFLALAVYAPSLARGPRYRPGLSWFAAPVWFNGPSQDVAESLSRPDSSPRTGATSMTNPGGGASASW